MVVAHCDDEVMWAGGLLSRYGEKFTIIACSIPTRDPERAWGFFRACEVFGAKAKLIPISESPNEDLKRLDLLDLSTFDLIVTHNAQGEYGHVHHRQLHEFISSRFNPITFGYPNRGDIVLNITEEENHRRMKAMRCYDHVSPTDGIPKWQALLRRYPIDLRTETHNAARLPDARADGGKAKSDSAS